MLANGQERVNEGQSQDDGVRNGRSRKTQWFNKYLPNAYYKQVLF